MKNLIVGACLLLMTGSTIVTHAQMTPLTPAQQDELRALKGGRVNVESDKTLLEPNEIADISLKLLIFPHVNTETNETEGATTEVDFPGASDPVLPSGYNEGVWKIVQGGGHLLKNSENSYYYTAPATAPPDKIMVISIELTPKTKTLGKVTVFQTLYFVDDPTAIVVNLPKAGFNNQKYINTPSGGVKMPTMQGMDPRVAARMTPDIQAQMAKAQAAVSAMQQQTGINVAALTSNAMAYYNDSLNITTIKITDLVMQMENGRPVKQVSGDGKMTIFELSFTGTGLGTHPLSDKTSGAGFNQIGSKGCGCGNNQNGSTGEGPCNGYVKIKSIENGVMKGFFYAKTYGTAYKEFVKGYMAGNFTVNVAK